MWIAIISNKENPYLQLCSPLSGDCFPFCGIVECSLRAIFFFNFFKILIKKTFFYAQLTFVRNNTFIKPLIMP